MKETVYLENGRRKTRNFNFILNIDCVKTLPVGGT
jgi:hypothetical protein